MAAGRSAPAPISGPGSVPVASASPFAARVTAALPAATATAALKSGHKRPRKHFLSLCFFFFGLSPFDLSAFAALLCALCSFLEAFLRSRANCFLLSLSNAFVLDYPTCMWSRCTHTQQSTADPSIIFLLRAPSLQAALRPLCERNLQLSPSFCSCFQPQGQDTLSKVFKESHQQAKLGLHSWLQLAYPNPKTLQAKCAGLFASRRHTL